jgi:hypothetical protein
LEARQFEEARALLLAAANLDPDNAGTRELLRELRLEHKAFLYQQLKPSWIPKLSVPRSQLADLALGPREQYLLTRLKAGLDVATLALTTPLGEMETLRALFKLRHAGIIDFGR